MKSNLPIPNSSLQEVQLPPCEPDPLHGALSKNEIVVEAEQAIAASTESFTSKPAVSAWKVFTSTFVTIFLAELGDKTQMSTLLMSAEFHNPWVIFAGAGVALVFTTLIGVWVGQWLSARLSPRTLDIAAGIMLALISAWLVWDVVQM